MNDLGDLQTEIREINTKLSALLDVFMEHNKLDRENMHGMESVKRAHARMDDVSAEIKITLGRLGALEDEVAGYINRARGAYWLASAMAGMIVAGLLWMAGQIGEVPEIRMRDELLRGRVDRNEKLIERIEAAPGYPGRGGERP